MITVKYTTRLGSSQKTFKTRTYEKQALTFARRLYLMHKILLTMDAAAFLKVEFITTK